MSATTTEQSTPERGRAQAGGGREARGRDKQSAGAGQAERVPPRLKERYREQIAPALREEFKYANVMQIPALVKIAVNMGVGDAARDAKLIDGAATGCGSSSIACSRLRCRGSGTSAGCPTGSSTAGATTPSASPSN